MKHAFEVRSFRSKTRDLLREIDAICTTYYEKGYILTLRQLFYQLVSRNRIANTDREYKNLGDVVRNGRYAGALDWEHIQDRVRVLQESARWADPEDRIQHAGETYRIDTWEGQTYRPEVWIEKDALIEIAARPCTLLDVPYIAVKAYSSVSARWEARKRFLEYARNGQTPVILHLGDLDSTGDDCTRFLRLDMELLTGVTCDVRRLALNPDQQKKYALPPQPGKPTDPRYKGYVKKHGTDSVWELDALSPEVIEQIIEDGIRDVLNEDQRESLIARQESEREKVLSVSKHWYDVTGFLEMLPNGHREGYEAWRLATQGMSLSSQAVVRKSAMVDFHRDGTDRDAAIAEEMALLIGAEVSL
jgi:hypothetical protein